MVDRQTASSSFLTSRLTQSTANNRLTMLLDHITSPPLVSLFSSTSSEALLLATTATAPNTPESFISLLEDSTDGKETLVAWQPSGPQDLATRVASLAKQRQLPAEPTGSTTLEDLRDRVLHLQAPDCRTTSVKWGSLRKGKWREDGLGVELPVLHFQLKDLQQTMFIDVAVIDDQGEMHLVRASTWQMEAKLHPATPDTPTLLHLPLRFPSSSSTTTTPLLTAWTTISLPLARLLSEFFEPPRVFKAVTGVEVHATCRLRRVWFSEEDMPSEIDAAQLRKGVLPELAMFAAVEHDQFIESGAV